MKGMALALGGANEKLLEQDLILARLNIILGESEQLEGQRNEVLEILINAQRKQAEAAVKAAELAQQTGSGTGRDVYNAEQQQIREQLRRGDISLGGALGADAFADAKADLADFKETLFDTMKDIKSGMKSDIKDAFSQWAVEGAKAEDVLKGIG